MFVEIVLIDYSFAAGRHSIFIEFNTNIKSIQFKSRKIYVKVCSLIISISITGSVFPVFFNTYRDSSVSIACFWIFLLMVPRDTCNVSATFASFPSFFLIASTMI